MTTDYSSAIDAVFGPQEEPAGAPSHNAPADAVDTSGGITAALDASPGVTEQRARETLTPAPEQKPEEFPWSNPAAAWYTPPEEKPAPEFSTGTLRLQMAGREVLRHELLPEGKTDDGTGALLRASFALNAASQYSRDDAFTAATASAALGMPLGMTLDNLDKARDMLGEYTPAKVKDFAPGFLRLVQYDYDSAILWRHDLATANAVSKAFDNAGEGLAGLSGGLALAGRVKNPVELDPESRAAALDRGVNYAALSLAQMGFNLGKLALEGFGALARGVDENYQPEDLAGKPVATAILEASDTMGEWVKNLSGVREKIGLGSPLYGLSVWDNPDVLLDSRWWLENTPGAVASMLPILGAYAKGGAAAAGLTGLVMNGNEVYTDLLDAGMEDNSRTRLYSLLGGAAMSTLDVVGLSGIFGGKVAVKKAAKEAILQAAKGGIKAAAYVSKRAGQAYLFEGGTEWLQNLVKAGVEGAAKGKDFGGILSDIGEAAKQLEDFILGGLMGGGIGGVHAHGQVGGERARQRLVDSITRAAASEGVVAARAEVESVVQDNAEAQQRMTFAQSLTQMAEAADGSTMRAADPAIFEREADKLIPEGARAVWLDVDMVREFIEADGARLEALGLTAREVAEALQVQAGAVKVSTARLMSRFEGDDRALLLQNARMTPGGMTLTEAQEFDPQKRAEAAAERIRARNSVNAETGRERTRLKNEFVQAGYAPHVAEYYATLHAEQARTFADRYGMDPVMMLKERSVVRGEPDNIGDNALYHPMNPGTDLDAPVSVVAVQPRFEGKKLWELMKGKGRSALCDAVVGVYTNRNTGWVIKVTGYGADHAINSATRRGVGGIEHMEAVVNLPSLIESAVLVESHKDKKNQGLAAVHRMYAPMLLGKDMYAVKLTVKESPEGMVAAIEDVRKLYDVSLEKKMPGDLFAPPPDAKETLTGSATPTPGISEISLRSLLEDVNDSEGNRFFQPMNPGTDLDAPLTVVTVRPRFEGKKLWELMKGNDKAALRKEIVGAYVNADTGWRINLTGSGVDHAVSSAKKSMNGIAHMEAVANLPALIEKAALVESHKDKKGQRLAAVHRMYAPMFLDGNMYAIKLTVKESQAGMVAEIADIRRLYDVSLEKKMPGDPRQPPDLAETSGKTGSTPGISEISLRSLLEDVNDSEGNRFFQPMNPGTDLDAPLTVVTVRPRFEGKKLWELMKGNDKAALRKEIVGAYVNADTGWRINLTGSGVDHAVSSAKKSMNGIAHMEAVAGLPRLIESAMLVESHADRKGQGLKAIHRMYAPMQVGNDVYAVKLTVKELDIGRVAEIEDVRKLYDLILEKKMPGDLRQGPGIAQNATGKLGSTPGISEISLRSLLEDVNDSGGNRFFQAMNPGADLDAPVTVVAVRPRFVGQNPRVLRKRFPDEVRRAVLDAFKAGVVNEDTGLRVNMSASDFKEHLKFDDGDVVDGLAQLEAIAALPGLMREAKLVESYDDKKGADGIQKMHRFQAALRIGGKDYSVKMTVKEYKDGFLEIDASTPLKLYHHRLEKEMPAGNSASLSHGDPSPRPSAGIHEYTLRSLLEDVNDSEGNRFFQAMNPGADLDAPVTVVAVRPRFVGQNPRVLRKRFPDDVRRAVLDAFKAGVVNEDTGLTVGMSSTDFREHFDSKNSGYDLAHLEAIAALPELMRTARLVESHKDKKPSPGSNVKMVHRFMAALRIGGEDFALKLTVKEFNDGSASLNMENPVKLYHHRIEKALSSSDTGKKPAMPTTIAVERDVEQSPPRPPAGINAHSMTAGNSDTLRKSGVNRPSAGIHEYTLRSLLEDVNDSEGRRFFQPPLRAEEPTRKAHSLPQRFAALPVVEADSSQWFGKGKEIEADKKNLRKNLKEWAKENFSRDTAASNADTGWEVQVTAKGVKNSLAHGFNATLARSVPFIPQIIEGGIHVDSIRKTPRLMSHIFANKIKLDGQDYVVGFVVREDANGNRFYDHELTEIIDPGLHNHAELPEGMGGQWERANRGDVMNILREKLGVNDGSGRILFQAADADPANARGAASFGPDGRSVTSIFKDASDLSTPIHEGAHVFINDLIRVVMDGGRMAEQLYAREITVVNKDTSIDDSLRLRRQRALLRRWNKHKTGLWQAREDLAALVENANAQREAHGKAIGVDLPAVTLEEALQGQLTQEQIRTLQEVNAAGFEAYMREGKAPSSRLAAVFHRMRQWLASIYRLAGVHGVKPSPEVRRVFDRMLATDEALRKSQAGAALADEGAFLSAVQEAETGLAPDESGEWTLTDRINDKAALNQDSEYERLQELYDRAEAEVTARMDKATLQDRNKRWKAYFDEGKEIARGDVFYEIMAALSVEEGSPYSGISRDWLERRYGKAAVADFLKTAQGRRLISKDGGVALDAVGIGDIVGGIERADVLGLTDADGLYNYLYDNVVVRRRNMVNDARAYADQRMADDDARAEAGGDEPGEAYRNYLEEVEAAVLRLAARQDSGWRTKEQQARWVEEHRTPLAEVRRRVKSVLRGKKLRDIQPNQFVGEVRKALQERNASLAAGNAPDALAAVDRARTALESWIEANRIVKERQAFEKQAARLAALKRDVVLPEAWTAIQDVLERFRLVPPRGRMEGESATLSETVLSLCEDAAEINGLPAIAEWLLDENARANYRDLTPERIQDVKDVLSMLEHMGRQGLAANRESEAAEIQEVAEGGAEAMSGLKELSVAREGTAWHRWQGWMRSFFGNMISSLQWKFRQADGFSNLGPDGRRGINEDRLWGGIVDGEARYQVRMSGLKERLDPIFRRLVESATSWEAKLGKTFAVDGKPLPVPEIMRRGGKLNWTSDRVLALVLNLGNEGNVARLREGYPDLSPEALSHLIGDDATRLVFPDWQGRGNDGLLSARDWRDVQEIGNVLHSQWADIQATHKRLFGFAPRGVEARPLTVRVGGQSVNLAGWYYPAVYDAGLSSEVKKRQEQQDAIVRTEAVCAAPAAKRGFTKTRANSGGAPLLLETGVVMSHLNDVCRFIEMAEIARFADRVTRAPQWAQAYIRAFGRQDYEAIRPNLKGLVLEERPPSDAVSKSADWLRERLVPWGLAFNLKTALLQSTAVFPAMNDLGASNTMRGISAVAKGGYALIKEIREISPYMKSRAANIDQDLRKAMRDIDARTRQNVVKLLGKELTWDDVVEAGMLPLISVDMATSSAIWMAAYNKEAAVLMNSPAGKPGIDPSSEHHTAAARAADMAVKAVNPDFNPSSRSQFLRSRGMARFLNIFSSAVVLFAQRRAYNAGALRQAWGKAPSAGGKMRAALRYARHEMYDFALQGAAMGVILSLAYGEDDPKKWGKNMAGAWLDAAAMRVPVFGSPVAALITGETWRGISAVYDQPWQMAKRASGALRKGGGDGLALSLADIISFELKVPVSRLGGNAAVGLDAETGEVVHFQNRMK